MRKATLARKTKETDLKIELNIDGSGRADIQTGIGFLDHMLENFTFHGSFDLSIRLKGDLNVDPHHSVEDLGIGLGKAFRDALGDKAGIERCGFFLFPLDESLATAVIDLCGRFYLGYDCKFAENRIGEFPASLLYDFFWSFGSNLQAVIHLKVENGRSAHHQAEAAFKALARSLRLACRKTEGNPIPSTKGVL